MAPHAVMLYAELIAARNRQWVNERLDTVWRLGGFVLSVRDAVCRINGVTGRLKDAPKADPWPPQSLEDLRNGDILHMTNGRSFVVQDNGR